MLFINDIAFLSLPYKATLLPPGPQNIEKGIIRLNMVFVHQGFTQYYSGLLDEWCGEKKIESVTDVAIGD